MKVLRRLYEVFLNLAAALVILLAAGLFAAVMSPAATTSSPKDSVVLLTSTKGYSCGGTVVVRSDVILTAAHCVDKDSGTVATVDGEPVKPKLVVVDKTDHALIVLPKALPNPPARWNRAPVLHQGAVVQLWGSHNHYSDLYRRGYVMGTCHVLRCVSGEVWEAKVTMVDLPVYYGDSGSGVFNEKNELVGVVSVYVVFSPVVHPMGLLPMTFTEEQLKRALG